tara:strand:+ start:581 stop:742 length:162 start_codon:yes stop_codon:yes gene_type:complete
MYIRETDIFRMSTKQLHSEAAECIKLLGRLNDEIISRLENKLQEKLKRQQWDQ